MYRDLPYALRVAILGRPTKARQLGHDACGLMSGLKPRPLEKRFTRWLVIDSKKSKSQAPLVLRWMASGHVRMLWRPEFNGDVALTLDRPAVQQSGLVTPLANGADSSRKKRGGAAQVLYIQHLAELSDGGADLYGFRRSVAISRPWITRPSEGDELTGLQSSGFMSRCRSGLRSNKNRELRGHCERRGCGDGFFRENQPERFAAVARATDKDCGRP